MAKYSAKGIAPLGKSRLKTWSSQTLMISGCTFWAFAAARDKKDGYSRPRLSNCNFKSTAWYISGKFMPWMCGRALAVPLYIGIMTIHMPIQIGKVQYAFTFNDYPDLEGSGSGTWVMTGKDWKDRSIAFIIFCGSRCLKDCFLNSSYAKFWVFQCQLTFSMVRIFCFSNGGLSWISAQNSIAPFWFHHLCLQLATSLYLAEDQYRYRVLSKLPRMISVCTLTFLQIYCRVAFPFITGVTIGEVPVLKLWDPIGLFNLLESALGPSIPK